MMAIKLLDSYWNRFFTMSFYIVASKGKFPYPAMFLLLILHNKNKIS